MGRGRVPAGVTLTCASQSATLKAIGFSAPFVLGLVLTESTCIAVVGGALGLWLARTLIQQDLTQGLILLYLPWFALAAGATVALATGLVAGLIPALNAMRLNVASALRRL